MGKNKATAAEPQAQTKQDGKQKGKQRQERQPQQRYERKEGGLQHYTSFLQVLALDIDHTSPSVLLFFDKERYLFNAGEGIQRLFREHKLKIRQVTSYFITRVSTETMSGLPGMALSVTPTDAGGLLDKQAACTVKGPQGLSDYVASFRGYINHENTVAVEEFDHTACEPLVKTDVVSISPIVVRLGGGADEAHGDTAAGHSGSPAAKRQRTGTGKSEGGASEATGGRQRPAGLSSPDQVVVYVVQLAGRPGKFLPDKAKQLGVRPGPLFGELQRGHSVTTDDGREVTTAEVSEPAVPGPTLLVVDSPSAEALAAVAADERVKKALAEAEAGTSGAPGGGDASKLCIAVHMAPLSVAADTAAMSAWRAACGGGWQHVVVTSGQHQTSAIPRATVFQAQLHALSPTVFPLFALDSAAAPPQLPEGALAAPPAAPAAAAAAAAAAKAAAAAATVATNGSSGKGKGGGQGGGGKGDGKGAAAGTGGGGAASLAVTVPQPVLPMEEVTAAVSAVRVNLMPPARQGLEFGDVFRYDSSAKVLEDMRANPEYAELLADAAAARGGAGAETSANAGGDVAAAAAAGTAAAGGADVDMTEEGKAGPAAAAAAAAVVVAQAEGGTEAGRGPESADAEGDMPSTVASGDRRQVELTFLGTASSQPSKFRNVSGCFVDLFDSGGLLVDCGEDAMGQMKRRFGVEGAERRLMELGLVWVSHMHADHHGGLYRLLEWRARRGAPPLLVLGPQKLFDVLVRYSAVVPIQFTFLPNVALSRPDASRQPPPAVVTEALEAAVARLGLAGGGKGLRPFQVDHIYDSHGLRLQGRAGWSVVFSADTRPCNETIAAARGATLLIHEATFEESMVSEARAKKHSTTAEAVSVGERAGAYRTVLTHFSTRYPTLPELDLAPHPSVAVAMDLMALNLADLPWLPRLVAPLGRLFKQLEAEKLKDDDDDE